MLVKEGRKEGLTEVAGSQLCQGTPPRGNCCVAGAGDPDISGEPETFPGRNLAVDGHRL